MDIKCLINRIVVVKDDFLAFGIVTYQSVAEASVGVDCALGGVTALGVRYAVQILDLQGLTGIVVNVSYASLLGIGTVLDGFGNVGCVVCHVLVGYGLLVRLVALYAW